MFQCSSKLDENTIVALNNKNTILGWVFTVIASIGIGIFTILGVFDVGINWIYYVIVFAIALCIGIGFLNAKKVGIKNLQGKNLINHYTFDEESFNVETKNNDEIVGTQKVYYKDLTKCKETENYIFLFINNFNAFPIDKEQIDKDDLIKLKGILKNFNLLKNK